MLLDTHTHPDRWSLLLHVTWRHQKELVCGLLTALIITTSSCKSTGFKPEKLGNPEPQTDFQQAMAAVAAPPLSIAAFDAQMLDFPNIRQAIVNIYDFMALDLAKVEAALSKRRDFDQLVGFKAELLLPETSNLYFVYPDRIHLPSITKITNDE